MQEPNQLPAPTAPMEYRAFGVFDHVPAEHGLFPVLDETNSPPLRAGEIAVVDTTAQLRGKPARPTTKQSDTIKDGRN